MYGGNADYFWRVLSRAAAEPRRSVTDIRLGKLGGLCIKSVSVGKNLHTKRLEDFINDERAKGQRKQGTKE